MSFTLLDWRRRVAGMYAAVRAAAETDPEGALERFREAKDRLFAEREHLHTWLYHVAWTWQDADRGVAPALALDRRFEGLAVVPGTVQRDPRIQALRVVDTARRITLRVVDGRGQGVARALVRTIAASDIAAIGTLSVDLVTTAGITDNLGIRSAFDRVVRQGSIDAVLTEAGYDGAHAILMIVVNAQREPDLDLEPAARGAGRPQRLRARHHQGDPRRRTRRARASWAAWSVAGG